MNKKVKVSIIISVCLVVAGLVAAAFFMFMPKQANYDLKGSINVTAEQGIEANITGSVTGTSKSVTFNKLIYSSISKPKETDVKTWENKVLNFENDETKIVINITVSNVSTNEILYVDLMGSVGSAKNVEKVLKADGQAYESGEIIELPSYKGDNTNKIVFTIEFSVDDVEKRVNKADFTYQLSLYNEYIETEKLIYEFNEENQTASVKMVSVEDTCGKIIIPETVIGPGGIPYTVTSIAENGFNDCTGITSVSIPDTITSIGLNAFTGCSNLGYTIYENCKYIGNANNPYHVVIGPLNNDVITVNLHESCKMTYYRSFFQCAKLENINLPIGLKIISYQTFTYCSLLKNITIPNTVESIEGGACAYTAIEKIIIPDSVTNLAKQTFYACTNLKEVTLSKNITYIHSGLFSGCSSLETVDFHTGITGFDTLVFNNCTSLKSITIPETVHTMKDAIFQNCKNLQSVSIPDSVTTMDTYIFFNCSSLKSFVFPKDITIISAFMFTNCSSLTSVVLPENIKRIDQYAFYKCQILESINLSDTVEVIGRSAFNNCRKINIKLPANLREIHSTAFQQCYGITNITLPTGLEFIGDFAFNHCCYATNTVIKIPPRVKQIGGELYDPANPDMRIIGTHVFYDTATNNLTKFEVDENNPYFMAVDGVLYRKENGVPTVLIAYPSARTDSIYEMPNTVVDAFELSMSRSYYLKEVVLSDNFNIYRNESENLINNNWGNNLATMLYCYTSVSKITCKETNPNYISYNGAVYSKDGSTLYFAPMLSGLNKNDSETKTLIFKEGLKVFSYGALGFDFDQKGNYNSGNNLDEANHLKRFEKIIIPATVIDIHQNTIDAINILSWIIEVESGNLYYRVNANGKLEKIS